MTQAEKHIALLLQMLAIPALSRKEGQRADLLEVYFQGLGFPVHRVNNNLIVGEWDVRDSRKSLMLNSHIDTVPPTDGWTTDPFVPVVDGEKLTGLGSNDAGASVVSMIRSFEILRDEVKDDLRLVLVISAEEEVSGKNGVGSLIRILGDIDGAIIGEPTNMHPAIAERGLMVIDAEVRGKAGHAARDEGENAIYKALKDISEIEQLRFDKKSDWLPDPSAQVTMIESGNKHNVVPDLCKYVIDVRSNDLYSNNDLLDILKGKCGGTLIPRSTRLTSSYLPKDHFLNEAIGASGLTPFGSQTLSDMAVIPFPAVKMGPGFSERSHSADEYILLGEIEDGVSGYVSFIRSICRILKNK
jgi:acetylornithine deacetylase